MRKLLLLALAGSLTLAGATAQAHHTRRRHRRHRIARHEEPPPLVDSYFLRYDRDARPDISVEHATHHR